MQFEDIKPYQKQVEKKTAALIEYFYISHKIEFDFGQFVWC